MRSISSAIISFVIFYIGLCLPKDERKQRMTRGCLFCLSFIMLINSIHIDDFRTFDEMMISDWERWNIWNFYPTNEYREVTLQVGLNSVQFRKYR